MATPVVPARQRPVDPLRERPVPPDRVFYDTGVLLNAEDFRAEQTYHRGRLARVLGYLQGSGTVAGLAVRCDPPVLPPPGDPEQELTVEPGLAIDRLGRLIEVPRRACIRLNRWYEAQAPEVLIQGLHGDGVVVDVFIRFVACEHGKTPAFAAGPFDALDAAVPSRLRDWYELSLVVRREQPNPPLPQPSWPDLAAIADPAARRTRLHEAIFAAWREGTEQWDDDGPVPAPEHAAGQDPTALFLARALVPASGGSADARPARTPGAAVRVDNGARPFVYTAGALARWLGV